MHLLPTLLRGTRRHGKVVLPAPARLQHLPIDQPTLLPKIVGKARQAIRGTPAMIDSRQIEL
jgi:hypothetical protein